MATVTEMRAALREAGEDVPVRGKLSDEWVARYDELKLQEGSPDPWPDDDDLPDVGADTPSVPEEVRPSRKRARSAASTKPAGSLIGRLLSGGGDGKSKPKGKGKPAPRVSLERLVTRFYAGAGRVLAPVSPAASACLRVQGPMAGVMLNDIAMGTVVDRMLQPVARAEEKIDVLFALAVPPVACIGLEMTAGLEPTPEVLFRRTVLMQMLREGLRTGLEVTEKYASQIAEAAEREIRYDSEVDRLLSLIFAPPPGEMVPEPEPAMAGAAA